MTKLERFRSAVQIHATFRQLRGALEEHESGGQAWRGCKDGVTAQHYFRHEAEGYQAPEWLKYVAGVVTRLASLPTQVIKPDLYIL